MDVDYGEVDVVARDSFRRDLLLVLKVDLDDAGPHSIDSVLPQAVTVWV